MASPARRNVCLRASDGCTHPSSRSLKPLARGYSDGHECDSELTHDCRWQHCFFRGECEPWLETCSTSGTTTTTTTTSGYTAGYRQVQYCGSTAGSYNSRKATMSPSTPYVWGAFNLVAPTSTVVSNASGDTRSSTICLESTERRCSLGICRARLVHFYKLSSRLYSLAHHESWLKTGAN